MRHQFDPVGPHRGAERAPVSLVRALSALVARIRAEHAAPADPLELTDAVLREKLALAMPADVVDRFLGMWSGTATFTAAVDAVAPGDALDPAEFASEPRVSVEYDPVTARQSLTYRGALTQDSRDDLVGGPPASPGAHVAGTRTRAGAGLLRPARADQRSRGRAGRIPAAG